MINMTHPCSLELTVHKNGKQIPAQEHNLTNVTILPGNFHESFNFKTLSNYQTKKTLNIVFEVIVHFIFY